MGTKHSLVLRSVLQVMRPLVRLLLCHGVTYPAVAGALKSVFVQAAQDELARQGMARTDSALTLLSGVHRKDVRELRQPEATAPRSRRADGQATPLGLAGEVVGRWMSDRAFRGRQALRADCPSPVRARSTRWWPASARTCGRVPCSTSCCAWAS